MNIEFKPQIKTLGFFNLNEVYDFKAIRDEQMFFSCDPLFVMARRGVSPITNKIFDIVFDKLIALPEKEDTHIVIDTRVNMLMPGQYPSIPGWHCDDVPRDAILKQPDFNKCDNSVQHFMVLVSDTKNPAECVSGTEFVTNDRTYDIDTSKAWQSLHENVEADKDKHTRFVKERELVQFNQLAIHRASPALVAGWRLFVRFSVTHRKPVNEIRNQVQVYVNPDKAGW